jgi:hypothetical protein
MAILTHFLFSRVCTILKYLELPLLSLEQSFQLSSIKLSRGGRGHLPDHNHLGGDHPQRNVFLQTIYNGLMKQTLLALVFEGDARITTCAKRYERDQFPGLITFNLIDSDLLNLATDCCHDMMLDLGCLDTLTVEFELRVFPAV